MWVRKLFFFYLSGTPGILQITGMEFPDLTIMQKNRNIIRYFSGILVYPEDSSKTAWQRTGWIFEHGATASETASSKTKTDEKKY
jgi:hypothetical protein